MATIEEQVNVVEEKLDSDVNYQRPGTKRLDQIESLLWRVRAKLDSLEVDSHVIGVAGLGRSAGCTTMVSNLAVAAADHFMGPVLLIDATHSRPAVHKVFGKKSGQGLVEVLMGSCTAQEAIVKSGIAELDLLTVGDAKMLAKSRFNADSFESLLAWARSEYRTILIDLPPADDLRQFLMLARATDMNVLAIRHDTVSRTHATDTLEQLRQDGVQFEGVVMTRRRIYTPRLLRFA